MNRSPRHLVILGLVILVTGGCVHGISRQNRQSALKNLTPQLILGDFKISSERLVLMGGEIIETRNLENESLIEVLQRPLGRE